MSTHKKQSRISLSRHKKAFVPRLYGLIRSSSGAVAGEFVLLLPVFMLFLFGIIAISAVLFVQVNMENAAREAARRMAVAEATGSGSPVACTSASANLAGTAENYACTYLVNWPLDFQVDADDLCPVREVVVTITVPASDAALSDIFGFFTGNLTATSHMRREDSCP